MPPPESNAFRAAGDIEFTRRQVLKVAAALGITGGFVIEQVASSPAFADVYLQYQLPFALNSSNSLWGGSSHHTGTDFGYPSPGAGAAVPAVANGTVTDIINGGESDSLGNRIQLYHADGVYSAYCHMIAASTLYEGQVVARGATVGGVGKSGTAADAYHLHLAMSTDSNSALNGVFSGTLDPLPYIAARLGAAAPTRKKSMSTLYLKSSTYVEGGTNPNMKFALAGDSPGTQANWLEGNNMTLAKAWAAAHGTWVYLDDTTYAAFQGYYLQPLKTTAV